MHNPFIFRTFASRTSIISFLLNAFFKYLIVPSLLLLFVGIRTQAQVYTGEQYVLGAAGQSDKSVLYQVDWTIVEPLVEFLHGSRKKLTQGFHQSLLSIQSSYIFSILDHDHLRHFSVFPNPFISDVSVRWNFSENLNLLFEVFTLDGKRVFARQQNAMDLELFLELSNLKPSMYILRISDPQRNFFETHKLIKH